MERVLERKQVLPVDIEEAWSFFSNPANLDVITPPELRFEIVSLDNEAMYEGQIIEYRIRVAPLIWTSWITEIVNVTDRVSFADVQRKGPYKKWHHTHTFRSVGDRKVEMTDHISYDVGKWIFGEIAHALFVRRRLQYIFDFRWRKLEELFPA
ncbi:MAG: SRPBCC family protein [Bacteroidetes bacterium]|nr:SRPBCC family protein [Bacteroidota bacterium]